MLSNKTQELALDSELLFEPHRGMPTDRNLLGPKQLKMPSNTTKHVVGVSFPVCLRTLDFFVPYLFAICRSATWTSWSCGTESEMLQDIAMNPC